VNFLIWAVAVLVILLCLAALYAHKQLIARRAPIDDAAATIYQLQEARLDHLDAGEANEATAIEAKLDEIFTQQDNNISSYNRYISRFPGRIIALAVGLSKEEI